MGLTGWQQNLKSAETAVDNVFSAVNRSGALSPFMIAALLGLALLAPEADLVLLPELLADTAVDTSAASAAADSELPAEEIARNQFLDAQRANMLSPAQADADAAEQAAERAAIRKGTFGSSSS